MICNQSLTNITRPCGSGKGGLKMEVYITLRSNVDFSSIAFVETEQPYNVIKTLPLLNEAKWNKFEFNRNAADFTSEAQFDGTTNELAYFQNTLNIAFRKMDAALRLSVMALLSNEVVVAFEDNNGVKYFLGYDEYVASNSASHATGANKTDSNVVSIALTDSSDSLPYQISDECWATITANVAQ